MVILHPLSDFIDSNYAVSDLAPSYYYEGHCPQSGELLRLPRTAMAQAIAKNLMQHLANNDRYSCEGKMYGILLVELPNGEQRVLKAFSGLLNGHSSVEGWVPPIPGRNQVALEEARTLAELEAIKQELITLKQLPERQEYATLKSKFEQQLQEMSDRHQDCKHQRHKKRQILCETLTQEALTVAIEQLDAESRQHGIERRQLKRQHNAVLQPLKARIDSADAQIRELKQQRKALSGQLQAQMHAAYSLTNFSGQSLSLQQLMPGGAMPTGTGDCCAPKLLHYAATQGLKPLAMAEFWWGVSSANQDKIQGEFYEACESRCRPLMGFLLSGLSQRFVVGCWLFVEDINHQQLTANNTKSLVRGYCNTSLQSGDELTYHPIMPFSTKLTILYEDEGLIAVNKPPGLLSVPGRYGDTFDSVLSRLRHLLADSMALTAVHRLDQETSGILLLARNQQTHRQLSQQFQQRQIHKVYEAVLSGCVTIDRGAIALPLWADPQNRPYQKVDWHNGKPSLTRFQVIAKEGDYTRIEFMPLTGRTHQLRVHAADSRGLGIPILGDRLYGCRTLASRLHLHARELRFKHPQSGETLHLLADTPF
ncbi:MAG TPA: RNA pseudouridine synthase [Cyanobacteria bacterium UBA8543]|nr:RNA pseudouridine synthase [Cyanobacteria bacterium UBA8543]